MQRVSDLIGKSIVSATSGELVGKVSDVLFDPASCQTIGLVIAGGLFSSEHVLAYGDVQVLGKDAVVARAVDRVMGPKEWNARGLESARSSSLNRKRVMTSTGRQLGAVSDVYLNETTGAVEALEVSNSSLGGLVNRHSVLPQTGTLTIGPDAIVVSEDAARTLEEEPQG
jgi:uncharacterized protein YrrD